MKSINPYTGETINEYVELSEQAINDIIAEAASAQVNWREQPLARRIECVQHLANCLLEQKETYAKLITAEMGKLHRQAVAEVEKCAKLCDYYAEHAETQLSDQNIETTFGQSFVTFQPLGVIFAVMPWNFPFWQVFRFAVPALLAGNTCILKHASNVTGCSLTIENIFQAAEFPADVFRSLAISSDQVKQCIAHPAVRAVSLTGSTEAGKSVAALAGQHLKKAVLELGGSDPYLILEDADLDLAVEQCVTSRLNNAGQSCIAAKRFIVCHDVYAAFLAKLMTKMEEQVVGDPNDANTTLGPMVSLKARDELHQQVITAQEQGARCVLGGELPEQQGAFYPPTILVDPPKGTLAYTDELFGPVATVIRASDRQQAVEIANDTSFGLGGAIFSRNTQEALRLAKEEIEAGSVFVNKFVSSDPHLPFGGIKESGFGRELSGFGIHEFVNIKAISTAPQ